MRNLSLMFFLILFSIINMSSKKDSDNVNTVFEGPEHSYSNDYIRDTISIEINKGVIGNNHLFIINENILHETEIYDIVSKIKKDDIISVTIIDKTEANEKYPSTAKDGIVKINYYIDTLLKPEYYVTENIEIINTINNLISQGTVERYPLIVLDGKPLRGTAIKQYLDNLNNKSIKSITIMTLQGGLQMYGERAINGVVIINTLFERGNKKK